MCAKLFFVRRTHVGERPNGPHEQTEMRTNTRRELCGAARKTFARRIREFRCANVSANPRNLLTTLAAGSIVENTALSQVISPESRK